MLLVWRLRNLENDYIKYCDVLKSKQSALVISSEEVNSDEPINELSHFHAFFILEHLIKKAQVTIYLITLLKKELTDAQFQVLMSNTNADSAAETTPQHLIMNNFEAKIFSQNGLEQAIKNINNVRSYFAAFEVIAIIAIASLITPMILGFVFNPFVGYCFLMAISVLMLSEALLCAVDTTYYLQRQNDLLNVKALPRAFEISQQHVDSKVNINPNKITISTTHDDGSSKLGSRLSNVFNSAKALGQSSVEQATNYTIDEENVRISTSYCQDAHTITTTFPQNGLRLLFRKLPVTIEETSSESLADAIDAALKTPSSTT
jgi:hypothetical protein